MTGYIKLIAPIEPGGGAELRNLARRRGTTAKMLTELAVRQLLTTARIGTLPALPPLDPEIFGGLCVWLTESDTAALNNLAACLNTTPKALVSLAVRHLLVQASSGALPMMKPLDPPEADEAPWEDRAAALNFSKARLILNRLHFISEWGMTDEQRASLKELEQLKTVAPISD